MAALKKIVFFLLVWLMDSFHIANAQEGNVWYFGINAGLDFNTRPPKALIDGSIVTYEGCTTISNKRGQLLFYTDGVKVYDRSHKMMPNGGGLLGNSSSTQSAIIIPNPGDSNIYYIFTSDCSENAFVYGYNFSVVDMRLNGGMGNVTAQKNINLYKPSTERLTAVKAANGIDYWVITKGLDNNRFTAYKIDCKGINLNPVISNVGLSHKYDPAQYVGIGQMKVSPDGKKLCLPILWPVALVQLFDFDNNTGQVSNPVDLDGYTASAGHVYGIEFSPNSKLLYVSTVFDKSINQYDISLGNAAAINASKYVITTGSLFPYALQLSPDRRIFVAFPQNTHVSVINNPDVYGAGSNFSYGAVDLAERLCWAGLPAYIASFFDESDHVGFINMYIDCHMQFTGTTNLIGNLVWKWDFGDGSFGTGQTINHAFRKAGTYNVTLKIISSYATCGLPLSDSFSYTRPVTIVNNIFAVDYTYQGSCIGQLTQFTDSTILTTGSITNRTWDFGDGSPTTNVLNPVHTYSNTGIYVVKLLINTSGICNKDSMIKQVYIGRKPTSFFSPGNGCINQPLQFNDNSTGDVTPVDYWKWLFGDGDSSSLKNPVHSFRNYGNYTTQLQVGSYGCMSAAAILQPVIIDSRPDVVFDHQYPCLGQATIFTNSSSNVFGAIISNSWSFGDNSSSGIADPIHQYLKPGNKIVSLTVATQNGCAATLSKTIVMIKAVANAGHDTITLYDQPVQLRGSGGGSYSWTAAIHLNDATIANPVAQLKENETFTLETTSAEGCKATDEVLVKVVPGFDIFIPTAFTPNGDGSNDLLKPLPVGIDHLNYFKVYNRFGQEVFNSTELDRGWDGRVNGIRQSTAAYVWIVQAVDIYGRMITKQGTSVLIR